MAARHGEDYIRGLHDDRQVWLGAERIDVTAHPVLAGSLAGVAGWFDWQHAHADECLVPDPETGEPVGVSHLVPRDRDDLRRRAVAFERLARYSTGVLGRTPDYLDATLAGFAGRPDVFGANGDTRAVEAVQCFHREVTAGDLALTHTIV